MLRVKDLDVYINNKRIVKGVNLEIKKGELHVLIGPNASGKSSLCYAIMGLPGYKTKGKIILNRENLSKKSIVERAKKGIALAFQHPPSIKGVKVKRLLEEIGVEDGLIKELSLERLLDRDLNKGFSGGEKKMLELVQVVSQKPRIAILDEIDSGIDIKRLEKIIKIVRERLIDRGIAVLMVTHNGEVIDKIKPDVVHIMLHGKIICSSKNWRKVWSTIRRYGYEKCKECELRADK